MKQTYTLILLLSVFGFLNAEVTPTVTDILAVTPTPVAGKAIEYTFTVKAGAFPAETAIFFNKGTESSQDLTCNLNAGDTSKTTAKCTVTIPTAEKYKITVGTAVQTFDFTSIPTILKSISPAKADVETATKITLTAEESHKFASEKIQFHTAAPTDATTPTPVTCTAATDKKTTVCDVNLAKGNYTVYLDTLTSKVVLTVSSQYIALACGLLVSMLLF